MTKEENDAARQSMLDYLKEYGKYQQKKLAIAQEYACLLYTSRCV